MAVIVRLGGGGILGGLVSLSENPNFIIPSSTPSSCALTWSEPYHEATILNYKVYRSLVEPVTINGMTLIATLPASARSYNVTGLSSGKKYWFVVTTVVTDDLENSSIRYIKNVDITSGYIVLFGHVPTTRNTTSTTDLKLLQEGFAEKGVTVQTLNYANEINYESNVIWSLTGNYGDDDRAFVIPIAAKYDGQYTPGWVLVSQDGSTVRFHVADSLVDPNIQSGTSSFRANISWNDQYYYGILNTITCAPVEMSTAGRHMALFYSSPRGGFRRGSYNMALSEVFLTTTRDLSVESAPVVLSYGDKLTTLGQYSNAYGYDQDGNYKYFYPKTPVGGLHRGVVYDDKYGYTYVIYGERCVDYGSYDHMSSIRYCDLGYAKVDVYANRVTSMHSFNSWPDGSTNSTSFGIEPLFYNILDDKFIVGYKKRFEYSGSDQDYTANPYRKYLALITPNTTDSRGFSYASITALCSDGTLLMNADGTLRATFKSTNSGFHFVFKDGDYYYGYVARRTVYPSTGYVSDYQDELYRSTDLRNWYFVDTVKGPELFVSSTWNSPSWAFDGRYVMMYTRIYAGNAQHYIRMAISKDKVNFVLISMGYITKPNKYDYDTNAFASLVR